MFAICIEASQARGMGHFFRALNLAGALERAGQSCRIVINQDAPALPLLSEAGLECSLVDLGDSARDWEGEIIERHAVRVWVNDRLDTDAAHAAKVTARRVPIATFDDRGGGAAAAALNVAALAFDPMEPIPGRRILRGIRYLILNQEIARYRRLRHRPGRLLVTLGGSDTYGVTIQVLQRLRTLAAAATVIVGPAFAHHAELADAIRPGIEIKQGVRSLIAEFGDHDLAITGGGITPFEANASGLPCIVIANEPFEIPAGLELSRLGGSVFAGYYADLDQAVLTQPLPLEQMSRAGMEAIDLEGADRVVRELMAL